MIIAIPRDKVKKACPTAANIAFSSILDQSGININSKAFEKESRVKEYINKPKRIIASRGIRIKFSFSIPFFTPFNIIWAIVSVIIVWNKICKPIFSVINVVNTVSASCKVFGNPVIDIII